MNFYDLTWENSFNILPRNTFSCFISNQEDFPVNKIRGIDYLQKYNFLGKELSSTSEIIYRKIPELEKFKNKKILAIGAGPSTNWYDWKAEEYDYIFSCNHFFLNEKIQSCAPQRKVDLALLTDEVDLSGEAFLNYLKANGTIIGFEDYNKSTDLVKKLRLEVDNPIFQCLLRFQGKIGVAPKLIILAILLGASRVDYVGVDGHSKNYKKGTPENHSFQKNKIITTDYPYEFIVTHYRCLKRYLENEIGQETEINNLGEGYEQNVMSTLK